MSSFFSTTPTNDHLLVSSQFWIFWAVSIPLTGVVIVTYTLWVQRAEVRAWYARERDLEKGEKSDGARKEMVSTREDRKQV
jgi:hypothetical protein